MTEKQKRFANEYISCLNVVQSAKKTGYSPSAGYKLMKNEEVKNYIDKQLIAAYAKIQDDSKSITDTIKSIMEDKSASNKDRLKAAEILTKISAATEKAKEENEDRVIIISGEDQLKD